MLLVNNGTNPLSHGKYKLPKGAKVDIPDEVAKIWLGIPGVEKYVTKEDVNKAKKDAEAKAAAEIAAEKARADAADKAKKDADEEIAKLKAELAELKKAQKTNK